MSSKDILVIAVSLVFLGACASRSTQSADKPDKPNSTSATSETAPGSSTDSSSTDTHAAAQPAASKPREQPSLETAAEDREQASCSYSQEDEEELVSKTLEKLGISRASASLELVDVRRFGCESLLVIPVLSKQELGADIFDAHVVLVGNGAGEIIAQYVGKEVWTSTSVVLRKVEIEPTTYNLNGSGTAFGLKVHYKGESRVNPYKITEMSIYAREGAQLNLVLKDHLTDFLWGEIDTRCNGKFEERHKSLEVLDSKTNGYADLKFTETIEKSVLTDQKCERTVVESSQQVEIFRVRGGTYENAYKDM